MKKVVWPFLVLLLLSACRSHPLSITIINGEEVTMLSSTSTIPADILSQAKIDITSEDRLIYLGSSVPFDVALPQASSYTLTFRRAVNLTVVSPSGKQVIQTSALTVGQALSEAGYSLHTADRLEPPAETPVVGPMTVTYQPVQELIVTLDGAKMKVFSTASTVGQALAEAGIPLMGLDYSAPVESAPLPKDGRIRVVHVVETVALTQKAIPYSTRTESSADVEIDHQELLQGGEPGLAVSRVRTRTEDGVQISQQSESESTVRSPQDRILGVGTKIVIRTTTVDGVTIEYWRTLSLYATSYSPCRSATASGACSYGTSSGMKAQKGVVAMQYYWYLLFGFEHLYIPGYGKAVVGDVGGGYQGSHYWIDLGYDDDNYVEWGGWVTVYFLTPVPSEPGYVLP
jgi:resuscitation-promoting factor RpfB